MDPAALEAFLQSLPPSGWMWKQRSKLVTSGGEGGAGAADYAHASPPHGMADDETAAGGNANSTTTSSTGKGLFGAFRAFGADKWERRYVSIRGIDTAMSSSPTVGANNAAAAGVNAAAMLLQRFKHATISYGKTITDVGDKTIPFSSIRAVNALPRDTMRRALKCPASHADKGWVIMANGKEITWAVEESVEARDRWVDYFQNISLQFLRASQQQTQQTQRSGSLMTPPRNVVTSPSPPPASSGGNTSAGGRGGASSSPPPQQYENKNNNDTYDTSNNNEDNDAGLVGRKPENVLRRLAAGDAAAGDDDEVDIAALLREHEEQQQQESRSQNGGGGGGNDDDFDNEFEEYLADEQQQQDEQLLGQQQDAMGLLSGDTTNGFSGDQQQQPILSREQIYRNFLTPIANTPHLYMAADKIQSTYKHLFIDNDGPSNAVYARFFHKISKKNTIHEREIVITDHCLYLFAKGHFGRHVTRTIELPQIVGVIESTADPTLFAVIIPSFHDILLRVVPSSAALAAPCTNRNATAAQQLLDAKHQFIAHLFAMHRRAVSGRPFIFRETENVPAVIRRTEDDQHLPLISKPNDRMRVGSNGDIFPTLRTNADSIVYFSAMVTRINSDRVNRVRGLVLTDNALYTLNEKHDAVARRTALNEIHRLLYDINTQGMLFKSADLDTLITVKDDRDFQTLLQLVPEVARLCGGHTIRVTPSSALFSAADWLSQSKLSQYVHNGLDSKKVKKLLKKSWMTSVQGMGALGHGVKNVGMISVDLLKSAGKGVGGVLVDNVVAGELLGAMGAAGNLLLLQQQQRCISETILSIEDEERLLAAHHISSSSSTTSTRTSFAINTSAASPVSPQTTTTRFTSSAATNNNFNNMSSQTSNAGGGGIGGNKITMYRHQQDRLQLQGSPQVQPYRVGLVSFSSDCKIFNLSSHIDKDKSAPRLTVVGSGSLFLFEPPADAANWKIWKTLFSNNNGNNNNVKPLALAERYEYSTIKGVVSCTSDPRLVGILTTDARHTDVLLRFHAVSLAVAFMRALVRVVTETSSPSIFSRVLCPLYHVLTGDALKQVLKKTSFDPAPTIALRRHPLSDVLGLWKTPDVAETCRRYGDNTIYFSGLAWRFRKPQSKKNAVRLAASAGSASEDLRKYFKSFVLLLTNSGLYMCTKGGYDIVRRTDIRSITHIYLSQHDPDAILFSVPEEYDLLFRIEGRRREFLDRLHDAFLPWTDYGWYCPGEAPHSHARADYFYPTAVVKDLMEVAQLQVPQGFSEAQASQVASEIANKQIQWFQNDLSQAATMYNRAVTAAAKGFSAEDPNFLGVFSRLGGGGGGGGGAGVEGGGGAARRSSFFGGGGTSAAGSPQPPHLLPSQHRRTQRLLTVAPASGGAGAGGGSGSGGPTSGHRHSSFETGASSFGTDEDGTSAGAAEYHHAEHSHNKYHQHQHQHQQHLQHRWQSIWTCITKAISRVRFAYCRAYIHGLRNGRHPEMATAAKLMVAWKEMRIAVERLHKALRGENLDVYLSAKVKAAGFAALTSLVEAQKPQFERIEDRQACVAAIANIIDDGIHPLHQRRAELFTSLEAAVAKGVRPHVLRMLLQAIDRRIRTERVYQFIAECSQAVAFDVRRARKAQQKRVLKALRKWTSGGSNGQNDDENDDDFILIDEGREEDDTIEEEEGSSGDDSSSSCSSTSSKSPNKDDHSQLVQAKRYSFAAGALRLTQIQKDVLLAMCQYDLQLRFNASTVAFLRPRYTSSSASVALNTSINMNNTSAAMMMKMLSAVGANHNGSPTTTSGMQANNAAFPASLAAIALRATAASSKKNNGRLGGGGGGVQQDDSSSPTAAVTAQMVYQLFSTQRGAMLHDMLAYAVSSGDLWALRAALVAVRAEVATNTQLSSSSSNYMGSTTSGINNSTSSSRDCSSKLLLRAIDDFERAFIMEEYDNTIDHQHDVEGEGEEVVGGEGNATTPSQSKLNQQRRQPKKNQQQKQKQKNDKKALQLLVQRDDKFLSPSDLEYLQHVTLVNAEEAAKVLAASQQSIEALKDFRLLKLQRVTQAATAVATHTGRSNRAYSYDLCGDQEWWASSAATPTFSSTPATSTSPKKQQLQPTTPHSRSSKSASSPANTSAVKRPSDSIAWAAFESSQALRLRFSTDACAGAYDLSCFPFDLVPAAITVEGRQQQQRQPLHLSSSGSGGSGNLQAYDNINNVNTISATTTTTTTTITSRTARSVSVAPNATMPTTASTAAVTNNNNNPSSAVLRDRSKSTISGGAGAAGGDDLSSPPPAITGVASGGEQIAGAATTTTSTMTSTTASYYSLDYLLALHDYHHYSGSSSSRHLQQRQPPLAIVHDVAARGTAETITKNATTASGSSGSGSKNTNINTNTNNKNSLASAPLLMSSPHSSSSSASAASVPYWTLSELRCFALPFLLEEYDLVAHVRDTLTMVSLQQQQQHEKEYAFKNNSCGGALSEHIALAQMLSDRILSILLEKDEAIARREEALRSLQAQNELLQQRAMAEQRAEEQSMIRQQEEQHLRLSTLVTAWNTRSHTICNQIKHGLKEQDWKGTALQVRNAEATITEISTAFSGNSTGQQSKTNGTTSTTTTATAAGALSAATTTSSSLSSHLVVFPAMYSNPSLIPAFTPSEHRTKITQLAKTVEKIISQLKMARNIGVQYVEKKQLGQYSSDMGAVNIPEPIRQAITHLDKNAVIQFVETSAVAQRSSSSGNINNINNNNKGNINPQTKQQQQQVGGASSLSSLSSSTGLSLATIAEVRRLWAEASKNREWVLTLHHNLHCAVALKHMDLIQSHLDEAAQHNYRDAVVLDAKAILESIRNSSNSSAATTTTTATPAVGAPDAAAVGDASSPSPVRPRGKSRMPATTEEEGAAGTTSNDGTSAAAATGEKNATTAARRGKPRKPALPPLAHTYDAAPAAPPCEQAMAELQSAIQVLLLDCGNTPTDAAFLPSGQSSSAPSAPSTSTSSKLIAVPEDSTEVRNCVYAIVQVFECGLKPTGIFKKVPRSIYDVLKACGDAEVSVAGGTTFAAPYTNRLVADFDRIKKLNSPHGHSASFALVAYVLFRGMLDVIVEEMTRHVPKKVLNDLYGDGIGPSASIFRHPSPYYLHDFQALTCKALQQVQWSFAFVETSAIAQQQRAISISQQQLRQSVAAERLGSVTPSRRNSLTGVSPGATGAAAASLLASTQQNQPPSSSFVAAATARSSVSVELAAAIAAATGTGGGAGGFSNDKFVQEAAIDAMHQLRGAIRVLSTYFSSALELRQISNPTTTTTNTSGIAVVTPSKPSPDDVKRLVDEHCHKGIGLVVRDSICPALVAFLSVGFRSSNFGMSRHLWDFVMAAAAKLKESARDLSAMAIPDTVELILSITDPDGRSKNVLHRLSAAQLKDIRLRMFFQDLLNRQALVSFLESVFHTECAEAVVACGGTAGTASNMSEVQQHVPPSSKELLVLLHKYYHLDRALLLCLKETRSELIKLCMGLSQIPFSLCIDAELW